MANNKDKQKKQEKTARITRTVVYSLIFVVFLVACFVPSHLNIVKTLPQYRRSDIFTKILAAAGRVFTHPKEAFPIQKATFAFIGAVSFLYGLLIFMESVKRKTRKHDNNIASAHFMTKEEKKDYNDRCVDPFGEKNKKGTTNMILSKDLLLSMQGFHTRKNCNLLVLGAPGTGKSRFLISPNILQYNANYIITDPSGELYRSYAKGLEDNGYKVKVFNLVDMYKSYRYNPFHYIKREKDAIVLVDTFIQNTTDKNKKGGDAFWENSEKLLLTALVLYVWHEYPEEKQTMEAVVRLLSMAEINENDTATNPQSPLDRLFDELGRNDPNNLAVRYYKEFKLGGVKTLKSILISVAVRMQTFKLPDVMYLTSEDDFHFENFSDTKQALFVIIPTGDVSFNFLVAMMYSQMFQSMYSYCETDLAFGSCCMLPDGTSVRVEQADLDTKNEAKTRAEAFVDAVHNKTDLRYNDRKDLWEIYTEYEGKDTLVAWRGEKEKAEKLQKDLKELRVVPLNDRDGRCLNHVRFMLDEFANIGQIPDFEKKLSTMRKYDISCTIIIQLLSQLKTLYKDDWATIAGDCDTCIFLGGKDTETNKWIVEQTGKRAIRVMNESYHAGTAGGSESIDNTTRELITVDEVSAMDTNDCLVLIAHESPYMGPKYELTDHPNYKYAKSKSGQFVMDREGKRDKELEKPLHLRKKVSETRNDKDEKDKTPKQQDPKSGIKQGISSRRDKSANGARRIAAEEAAAAAKEDGLDDQDPIMLAFCKQLGISPRATDTQIKDAIESVFLPSESPSESLKYEKIQI